MSLLSHVRDVCLNSLALSIQQTLHQDGILPTLLLDFIKQSDNAVGVEGVDGLRALVLLLL